jgi:hypothetical protein
MKSLFAGLAFAVALLGAPAQAATTTLNFVSDCEDCSGTHGPGTQASATLVIEDLTWTANQFESGAPFYVASGEASSFSYHSDWLGTISEPVGAIYYSFYTADPTNFTNEAFLFSVSFNVLYKGRLDGDFVFNSGPTETGPLLVWGVYYGESMIQDYGTLLPGAWTVAAVPEPETYAMLLAGLGVLGAAAKRRKSKAA